MTYALTEGDPAPGSVRQITFVPFLPGGHCAAIPDGDGRLRLPSGEVRPGEHWLLDTTLRIPLETAGFRFQRAHPFAYDAEAAHLYAWLDGDRYKGRRPHAEVELVAGPAEAIAGLMGDAQVVLDAARSFRAQDDASYFADNMRLLEPAYLRAATPEGGSGFGGGPQAWRVRRSMIVEGLDRDGTFLDVGCANGLLMESVHAWAAERGRVIEPYGIDLAPGLVGLAQRRLPRWAGRIEVGNALSWRPRDGRRFTFAHILAETVPRARFGDLARHVLDTMVEPGGRLLLSVYQASEGTLPDAAEQFGGIGLAVSGRAGATAWVDA
jgi:hypothetical protein